MAENTIPLVKTKTRTESSNISVVLSGLKENEIIIPDYQRDADQWDRRKESLFIESLLNNLTIPAFFFAQNEEGKIEVIDGQQRLNTIQKYANDEIDISDDDRIDYIVPDSSLYRGKKYSQLSNELQRVFRLYPLTIINLPDKLELSTKLEIFRRINEGGTPLTAQDIRLSYYNSKSVYVIRLAGIHSDSSAAKRMKIYAKTKFSLEDLWQKNGEANQIWQDWWEGKALAKGQTPSEMFLWYLIILNRETLDKFLSNSSTMRHLKTSFRGSTEEALDIFCCQLHYTDNNGGTEIFPISGHGLEDIFEKFAYWIQVILERGLPGISVDKYKQTALLIGALVEHDVKVDNITQDAWDAISEFIRTPRTSGDKWLKQDGETGYPEQRGRWTGKKGQKAQCDAVLTLVQRIFNEYK